MEGEYIKLVSKHADIEITKRDNYFSVHSRANIPKGKLIILEHVLTVPRHLCNLIVNFNEYLFNTYHPRTKSYSEYTPEERAPVTLEKIKHNCFGYHEDILVTDTITKLNHSCRPNCCVFINHAQKVQNINVVFMEIHSVRNICAGDEITISYGPKTAHTRDFVCNCGMNDEQLTKIFNKNVAAVKNYSYQQKRRTERIIVDYLSTVASRRVLFYHCMVYQGIIMNRGLVSVIDNKGLQIMERWVTEACQGEIRAKDPNDEQAVKDARRLKLRAFAQIIAKHIQNIDADCEINVDAANVTVLAEEVVPAFLSQPASNCPLAETQKC